MIWRVVVHHSVGKQLQKFPRQDIKKIETTFEQLRINPYFGDIQKMEGEKDVWRRRVGSYRVFYELSVDKQIVFVFWIERRTSKTY